VPKIEKNSLTDQIFEYIKDQIISGNWKPGEKIPSETELAESLGVSRMSLRTAIQKANVLGLTVTQIGEGTFVKDFNMRSYLQELYRASIITWDNEQINDLRVILQIGGVRLALMTPPLDWEAKTQELRDIIIQMERVAANKDLELFHQLDITLHRLICSLCANDPLFMLYDAIEYLLDEATRQNVLYSHKYTGSYELVLQYHRDLVDSICAKDFEAFNKCILASRERSSNYYRRAKNDN